MESHDCNQINRIDRIEQSGVETAKQLSDMNVTLMRIETLLGERIKKYDSNIEEGKAFRTQIVNTFIGTGAIILIGCVGTIYAYGMMAQKVEIAYDHSRGINDK